MPANNVSYNHPFSGVCNICSFSNQITSPLSHYRIHTEQTKLTVSSSSQTFVKYSTGLYGQEKVTREVMQIRWKHLANYDIGLKKHGEKFEVVLKSWSLEVLRLE